MEKIKAKTEGDRDYGGEVWWEDQDVQEKGCWAIKSWINQWQRSHMLFCVTNSQMNPSQRSSGERAEVSRSNGVRSGSIVVHRTNPGSCKILGETLDRKVQRPNPSQL
jgi:hypothetical protein